MFVKPCFIVDENFAVFISGNHVSDFPGGWIVREGEKLQSGIVVMDRVVRT